MLLSMKLTTQSKRETNIHNYNHYIKNNIHTHSSLGIWDEKQALHNQVSTS